MSFGVLDRIVTYIVDGYSLAGRKEMPVEAAVNGISKLKGAAWCSDPRIPIEMRPKGDWDIWHVWFGGREELGMDVLAGLVSECSTGTVEYFVQRQAWPVPNRRKQRHYITFQEPDVRRFSFSYEGPE